MKTIGLIGGMSWESTVPYYRAINETIKERLGGLHSAKLVLVSVDFAEIEHLQKAGDWATAGQVLAAAAQSLERAGAEFVVLCTNTMHKVADGIVAATTLPVFALREVTPCALPPRGGRTPPTTSSSRGRRSSARSSPCSCPTPPTPSSS